MAIQVFLDVPNERQATLGVLDSLAQHLTKTFRLSTGNIRARVGEAAVLAIQSCPEYVSLVGGELRGELGVVSAAPVLNKVCKNIAEGVVVTSLGVRRVGLAVEGGVRIEMLKGDYSEVLSVGGGSYRSEGGFQIDWLRWLTMEGDRVLVTDHHYSLGLGQRSRTGLGVMGLGGFWRVPPQYSGTPADNWLTRALGKMGPAVETILQEEIRRNL